MSETSTPPVAAKANEGDLWAIVLAAGEGNRLASVTRYLYGHGLPKQFAALNSERTLLQQTMDRIAEIIPARRTVVVVAHNRRELAESQLAEYEGVQIVSQPANLGTGPGVLLPLSLVMAQCPTARVMITPSDHYIRNPAAFSAAILRAVESLPGAPSGLALLGAEAEGPATDLGWIMPRDPDLPDADVDLVSSFVEKPPLGTAKELFRAGGLWNTLIVFGSVDAFWRQATRHLPRHASLFNLYVEALGHGNGRSHLGAESLLARLYKSMPPADFSRAILQNTRGLAVVKLKDAGWCDCGTPERLLTCLDEAAAPERHTLLLKAVARSMQDEERATRELSLGNA